MDKRLADLRSEMAAGSVTLHLGRGAGHSPLRRFLDRALVAGMTLAAAAVALPAHGAGAQHQAGSAVAAADAGRYAAAKEFVDGVNARMAGARIAVVVETSNGDGSQLGQFVVGDKNPKATVCTSYAVVGRLAEGYGLFEGASFDWSAEPASAKAAFQHVLAQDVFSCLQEAGLTGSRADPASRLAVYDVVVRFAQAEAGAAVLSMLANGNTEVVQAEIRDLRELGDVDSRRTAEMLAEAVRGHAEGRFSGLSDYAALGDATAGLAARHMMFSLQADGLWKAPDGGAVSTNPADARFGWERVGEEGGDGPLWERRFADPELDAEIARAERDGAGLPDMPGHDAEGRECRVGVYPGGEDGPEIVAFCQSPDGVWENVPPREVIMDAPRGGEPGVRRGDPGVAVRRPDGSWAVGEDAGAEAARLPASRSADGRGWVVEGDVGFGASHVLVRPDGTNVFKDADGHTTAVVGGKAGGGFAVRHDAGKSETYELGGARYAPGRSDWSL